ncbi:anti-sigma factor family protein, partial [Streptomyces alfalfae]
MTGSHGHYAGWQEENVHETVGAYALGVLDAAEATRFEAHLAGCEHCAHRLEEFSGMAPVLAALADFPAGHGAPEIGERPAARPGPGPAGGLAGRGAGGGGAGPRGAPLSVAGADLA